MQKTWFITGATRGFGLEIAKAALNAGDRVVATGRNRDATVKALGADNDHLLSLALDVTKASQAKAAVDGAVKAFGGIDVLVNNAGYGHLGVFEETTDADVEAQFATNVFGLFNVTRAALPVMRAARKGSIFNLSSAAGLVGFDRCSLYSASKFAVEGFSETLAKELAAFNIHVTIVEPGPFRTDFLDPTSIRFGQNQIADYDDGREQAHKSYVTRNGQQPGDPAKLAAALVQLANEAKPPLRFVAGAAASDIGYAKLVQMKQDFDQWKVLTLGTDFAS